LSGIYEAFRTSAIDLQEFIENACNLLEIIWIILNLRNYSNEFQEVTIHEFFE
jgi:hypothetical protein